MAEQSADDAQQAQGLFRRIRGFLAPRARTWGFMVPLHLAAFLILYFLTARLLEQEIVATTESAARGQLVHVGHELHTVAMVRIANISGKHFFRELIAEHRDIDLQLFLPGGARIGGSEDLSQLDHSQVIRFLESGASETAWLDDSAPAPRMRGFRRIIANEDCTSCHQMGQTLAIASMSMDLSRILRETHRSSRRNLALLIFAWAAALGMSTAVVKRSVAHSAARIEADLAAAEAGEIGASPSSPLVLDPVSAKLHGSIREFIRRQRARDKEVATRLAHTDQLASLGKLAAGLAHEIKNPLAGIQGAIEILRQDLPNEPDRELCTEMLQELKRVNEILRALLSSSRPSPPQRVDTDMRKLLEETYRFLEPALRRRSIELRLEVAPGQIAARLDPAKIRQVVLNLVNNAAEAIEESGTIWLRAAHFPDGSGIVLSVEDDGPGIEADTLDKMFEPFYTTKFSGTGLGLSIARTLVQQHGGTLQVQSQPGKATTFFILLPYKPPLEPSGPEDPPGDR